MSSETNNDDANSGPTGVQPWEARADWAAGRVKPNGGSWRVIVVIAIVWDALCIGAGIVAWPHLREKIAAGEYLLLLVGIIPLLGLGLAINAVRSVINGRRLGRMWFELQTVPASVGQYLGGVIHSDRELNMKDGVRLTLTCYKEQLSVGFRDTRNRGRYERERVNQLTVSPEWTETQVLDRELLEDDRNRTALPVYFRLPREVPGTQARVGPVGYRWALEVNFDTAARARLMSGVQFDVPVFRTAASNRPFAGPEGHDPAAEFKSDKPIAETPSAEGMRVSASRRGGTVFTFQAPDVVRGVGCSVTLLFMAVIAAAIAAHLWKPHGSIEGPLIAACVCGLLILCFCYIRFHVNRLTFDIGEVEYEHTLFGIGVRKKFEPSLVASVTAERDKRDTSEGLWDVPLVLLDQKPSGLAYKKRHMLMRGLARETAQTVSSQLQEALAHAVAGKKREFRVASGPDPEIAARRRSIEHRVTKVVYALLVPFVAFLAWQILYVDYAKKRKTEPYQAAMRALEESPAARVALGEEIKAGWFANGSFDDLGSDTGWANLDIPVSGTRASGTLHLQANKHGGAWQYNRVALQVDGQPEEILILPTTNAP